MSDCNSYRFPRDWGKERTTSLVDRLRAIGINRAEELIFEQELGIPKGVWIMAAMLRRNFMTVKQLANYFKTTEGKVQESIEFLRAKAFRVRYYEAEKTYKIHSKPITERATSISDREVKGELKIGIVSDTHLCSKYARIDLLSQMYEIFKKEGVTEVIHGGNLMDGFQEGINSNDVHTHTLEGQVQYTMENYPSIDGIKTYFISTDCHSGWTARKSGIDVGKYVELSMKECGRNDLIHLGYLTATREYKIKGREEPFRVFLIHPKGGSLADNETGALTKWGMFLLKLNEPKPDVLISGHYHKYGIVKIGKIYCFHACSFTGMTPFMFSNKLISRLGGLIMKVTFNKTGQMLTFNIEHHDFDWSIDPKHEESQRPVWSHKGF